MNFITTNIRFPEDVYMQLKAEAAKNRMSLSAVVRQKVGVHRQKRDPAELAQFITKIDATAAYLGKKLKHFNSVAVIRKMRDEEAR